MEQATLQEQPRRRQNLLTPFLKSKDFTYLFIGRVLATLGSSITMVILPIVVMQLTESTVAMGTVMTAYMLPHVLILPLSGLIVDRLDRIKIMLFTDAIRFIVLTALTMIVFAQLIDMVSLYVFVAILGLMDGLFQPAYSAVRAKVFTPDIRSAANSVTQLSMQGITLFGPALGGLIVTVFSAGIGLGIDAFTYIASFVCLLMLRHMKFNRERRQNGATAWKTDFMEGIVALKAEPWLWITILAFSVLNICTGGILRILVPWLMNVHHGFEPYAFGLAISAAGAGSIVCAFLYGMRPQWKRRGLLAYGGIALSGMALLVMPFVSSLPVLMGLMFMEGFGAMLFGLIWEISLQELVPEEKFGRVASLDMLGSFALLPLGYVLTGWLAEWVGGTAAMVGLSAATIAIAVIVMMHKNIRQFN